MAAGPGGFAAVPGAEPLSADMSGLRAKSSLVGFRATLRFSCAAAFRSAPCTRGPGREATERVEAERARAHPLGVGRGEVVRGVPQAHHTRRRGGGVHCGQRFAADERAVTTMAMLAECIAARCGVPKVVLADRMVCLKGGVVADVVMPTPDYVRFATRYRFRPDF